MRGRQCHRQAWSGSGRFAERHHLHRVLQQPGHRMNEIRFGHKLWTWQRNKRVNDAPCVLPFAPDVVPGETRETTAVRPRRYHTAQGKHVPCLKVGRCHSRGHREF